MRNFLLKTIYWGNELSSRGFVWAEADNQDRIILYKVLLLFGKIVSHLLYRNVKVTYRAVISEEIPALILYLLKKV